MYSIEIENRKRKLQEIQNELTSLERKQENYIKKKQEQDKVDALRTNENILGLINDKKIPFRDIFKALIGFDLSYMREYFKIGVYDESRNGHYDLNGFRCRTSVYIVWDFFKDKFEEKYQVEVIDIPEKQEFWRTDPDLGRGFVRTYHPTSAFSTGAAVIDSKILTLPIYGKFSYTDEVILTSLYNEDMHCGMVDNRGYVILEADKINKEFSLIGRDRKIEYGEYGVDFQLRHRETDKWHKFYYSYRSMELKRYGAPEEPKRNNSSYDYSYHSNPRLVEKDYNICPKCHQKYYENAIMCPNCAWS